MKITRKCAGSYSATDGVRTVSLTHFSPADGADFRGWVAQAEWDRNRMSDPIDTLRDAKTCAEHMLKTATDF